MGNDGIPTKILWGMTQEFVGALEGWDADRKSLFIVGCVVLEYRLVNIQDGKTSGSLVRGNEGWALEKRADGILRPWKPCKGWFECDVQK